jgi:hypothetical protein
MYPRLKLLNKLYMRRGDIWYIDDIMSYIISETLCYEEGHFIQNKL